MGSRHQLSGCHLTLLEGQQRVFVQAGSIWVGESVDELTLKHFSTHLGCKLGHCLLELGFKTPCVGVASLSDAVACRLKLDGACCSRLNWIELGYKVCAKVGPRVALVCLEPTIQKAGLAGKVWGQSLEAMVLVPIVGVRAHYVEIEPLNYVTGAEGVGTANVVGFTCWTARACAC